MTDNPALAPCPFCRDGGQPYFKTGDTPFTPNWEITGCTGCGCLIHSLCAAEKWNTRSFLANDAARAAAYEALVKMGTVYTQMVIGISSTLSKKKHNLLRGAVVAAASDFIVNHAGAVRSALNDLEKGKP